MSPRACAAAALAALASLVLSACGGSGETVRVPSGSMLPTIRIGQVLNVDTGARDPRRGDIVLFHPPAGADPSQPVCGAAQEGLLANGVFADAPCGVSVAGASRDQYVKRVVGLPGDRISLQDGYVVLDGVRQSEPYVSACHDPGCTFPLAVTVPPGQVYVLGDNRGASDDSRYWGPVPLANVLGTVTRPGF